ncbi:MAG: Zn-dependent hydrolase [Rhodothermales bacterium]
MTPIDRPAALLKRYRQVRLEADLGALDDEQREMIRHLVEAAREMDAIYWIQAYGDRSALLASISDPGLRRYAEINYGPWDRLSGNEPFLEGIGAKPRGANFYPADMTPDEFEAAAASNEDLRSLYTMVRRDAAGRLLAVPYHEFFLSHVRSAAERLRRAAALTRDPGMKHYLELRADALETDDYRPSDRAWMDMEQNVIDVVIGPIETYEDRLFGYKAAYEAFVLVKDREWSDRLARYVDMLPMLQQGLPVDERYKRETPGTGSDLGVYDVVYYAGDANAGAKTIAINLPNDEEVQLEKGARRLQLKNAMRAKFEEILMPIARILIAGDQRSHVTFDAFFSNTLFHEVAHGLGIKTTLTGRGTVREALRDHYTAVEEGKGDILGLYMVAALHGRGEIDGELMDHFVTFLAGMFRSIRFGAASAHGRANLLRFNYFKERGAIVRSAGGVYRVDPEAMQAAITSLSERILVLQGDGDYKAVDAFLKQYGEMDATLQADLDRVNTADIPVDVVFEQGMSVVGERRA